MRGFLTLAVSLSALFFTGTAAYPTDPVDLETRGNIAKRSLPKLVHFDNNNPDDRKKNLKIRQAFRDSLQLMDYSVQQLQDNVFKQYFNEGDKSKVQDVFKKALGGDPGRGASELGDFYITNIDVNNKCGDNTLLGYTGKDDKGNQIIHFCERLYSKPLIKDVKCESLQDTVGAGMAVMGATLLHEFMHADAIGKASLGKAIIDVDNGYGPLQTRNLKDGDKLVNADNYTWLATENLWSIICQKSYSAPRDERDTSDPDCDDKTCTVQ